MAALTLMFAACGGGDDAATTTAASGVTTTDAATTTAQSATTTTEGSMTTTSEAMTTTTDGSMTGEPRVIEIVGLDEAFDTRTIEITAGEPVTIVFNNKDTSGEPHNLHVRTPDNDWFTQIAEAPDVQEITLSIDQPGEYEFFCDTHLQTMNGTVIVTAP